MEGQGGSGDRQEWGGGKGGEWGQTRESRVGGGESGDRNGRVGLEGECG